MVLRQRNVLVIILLFVVLGTYALVLQTKLAAQEPVPTFSRSSGFKGDTADPANDHSVARAKLVEEATAQEERLLAKTQELAKEVGILADTLQARKARAGLPRANKVPIAPLHLGRKPYQPQHVGVTDGVAARGGAWPRLDVAPKGRVVLPVTMGPLVESRARPARPAGVRIPAAALAAKTLDEKREAVVAAARHAWAGYAAKAWGYDELLPVIGAGKNNFGGLGATIVDSIDTLWLLGLREEFKAARDWIAKELSFNRAYDASVFETTIRILGGLLSAHDLSGDTIFRDRAAELGGILLAAYETPTGIPLGMLNLRSRRARNPAWTRHASILSELGTEQLEGLALSAATGNASFAAAPERAIASLRRTFPNRGLLPLFISPVTGQATTDLVSVGAMGDSYYEYLLKVWLFKGRRGKDEAYRAAWERAMDEMLATLLHTNAPTGLTYLAEVKRGKVRHKMDHLACFAPAMLALGAHAGAVTGGKADAYRDAAARLTETCWRMYDWTPTGLAPEFVEFNDGGMAAGARGTHNLLRPEAMEAMFVLWRTTGDEKYRDWAWRMFLAFEQHCRVEHGYAGVRDVMADPPVNDDTMQSFWLAETVKYLWLIFSPSEALPLDDWVLNTEAHPLRIPRPANASATTAAEPGR